VNTGGANRSKAYPNRSALLVADGARRRSDYSQFRVAATPIPENLVANRKTVTMLFADVKRSVELIEDLDPEEACAIVLPSIRL